MVSMTDATVHRIRRLSGPRQADFYRGDKKFHFMASQLIADSDGMIAMLFLQGKRQGLWQRCVFHKSSAKVLKSNFLMYHVMIPQPGVQLTFTAGKSQATG